MNGTLARPSANTKSKRQIELINKLLDELAGYDEALSGEVRADLRAKWKAGQATFSYCYNRNSNMIEVLKRLRRERNDQHRTAGRPVVDAGRYALQNGDDENDISFYQVKIDKKGRYEVFVQASSELHALPWPTAVAILRKIEVDPKAASILYGLKLHYCGRCGAELTKQSSREAGIGPICATRF